MIKTSRDRHLLEQLSKYGMFSTKQINALFFREVNSATMLRRLRILEANGFIQRVGKIESNNEWLWGVTSQSGMESGIEHFKTKWSKSMLDHDYKLTSLRLFLESVGLIKEWIPEHQIRSTVYSKHKFKDAKEKQIPDGFVDVEIQNYRESLAIELELNLKNKSRYQKTIRSYSVFEGLHGVWYFVSSSSILNCLKDYWKREGNLYSGVRPFFTLLDDLYQNGINAKMYGVNSIYSIKNYFTLPAQEGAHKLSTSSEFLNVIQTDLTSKNHAPISREIQT